VSVIYFRIMSQHLPSYTDNDRKHENLRTSCIIISRFQPVLPEYILSYVMLHNLFSRITGNQYVTIVILLEWLVDDSTMLCHLKKLFNYE
jgi:hypothetical protein